MTERPQLQVGQKVRKLSGYPFPGVVRSVFQTKAGEWRVVVEATGLSYQGMLHIFSLAQIGPR